MMATCIPGPALRPFVKLLWASDEAASERGARELVLPSGMMHLALRLSETPLRLFDAADGDAARSLGKGARKLAQPGRTQKRRDPVAEPRVALARRKSADSPDQLFGPRGHRHADEASTRSGKAPAVTSGSTSASAPWQVG